MFSLAICNELTNPQFGIVQVSGSSPRVPGDVATYQCDPGFVLVGDDTRTCQQLADNSADWDGLEPICQRL